MKITVKKEHKPNILHDEILEALPELRGTLEDGIYHKAKLKVSLSDNLTTFEFPDNVDATVIQNVIESHDSKKKTKEELRNKRRKESKDLYDQHKFLTVRDINNMLASVKTLEEMKVAVRRIASLLLYQAKYLDVQEEDN
jgi:hypothetical protein